MRIIKIQNLLLMSLTVIAVQWSVQSHASFLESWIRYPPPQGFYFLLKQKFPQTHDYCIPGSAGTSGSRFIVGTSSPLDGKPTSDEPGVSFQLWYLECLRQMTTIELAFITQKTYDKANPKLAFQNSAPDFRRFAGEKAFQLEAAKITVAERLKLPENEPWFRRVVWIELPLATKKEVIQSIIRSNLGSEDSYQYLGLGRSEKQLTNLVFEGVSAALNDRSLTNIKYLASFAFVLERLKLADVVLLAKILTLSLDEFLLE